MRHTSRSLLWKGQQFQFRRLASSNAADDYVWAVSRRGEFIGTMPGRAEETTKEFDVRCQRWVAELLER